MNKRAGLSSVSSRSALLASPAIAPIPARRAYCCMSPPSEVRGTKSEVRSEAAGAEYAVVGAAIIAQWARQSQRRPAWVAHLCIGLSLLNRAACESRRAGQAIWILIRLWQ